MKNNNEVKLDFFLNLLFSQILILWIILLKKNRLLGNPFFGIFFYCFVWLLDHHFCCHFRFMMIFERSFVYMLEKFSYLYFWFILSRIYTKYFWIFFFFLDFDRLDMDGFLFRSVQFSSIHSFIHVRVI